MQARTHVPTRAHMLMTKNAQRFMSTHKHTQIQSRMAADFLDLLTTEES